MPVAVARSACVAPAAGAAHWAVQVMVAPEASTDAGHEIAAAGTTSSETPTLTRDVLPVLVTSKVMAIGVPTGTDAPGAVCASSALIFLTTEMPGWAVVALAGSVSVMEATGWPLTSGVARAVAVSVCWTPAAGAGWDAVHVMLAPTARTVAGQTIAPVTTSSVTWTSRSGVVPLLNTTNSICMVDPGATRTPGAVLASAPLMRFTTCMPGATAFAKAGSVSLTGASGLPVARSISGVESASTGVPVAVPVLVCWVDAAGAVKLAVHVMLSAGSSAVFGQEIPETTESVTTTGSSRVLPVFVTRKETFTVSPVTISGPGAVLASAPLRYLTIVIAGLGLPHAWASSVSATGAG